VKLDGSRSHRYIQVVGEKANTCGTTAHDAVAGRFDHGKPGVPAKSSEGEAVTGEHGARKCEADSLLG